MGNLRFLASLCVVAAFLAISGCQGGGFPDLGLGSNDKEEAEEKPDERVSQTDLRAYCPRVRLREGTAFFNKYKKVRRGEEERVADNVIYQASISAVTRSCRYENGQLNMNIAVAGRVVPGPKAEVGTITMPIRVAVVRGEEVLYTELHQYQVVIDSLTGAIQFVFNDPNVSLPAPTAANLLVFAGYDEGPPKQQ
ncbi:MAG: hypothetical protein AB3N20_08350 [Rhizobiaceae bacterium]